MHIFKIEVRIFCRLANPAMKLSSRNSFFLPNQGTPLVHRAYWTTQASPPHVFQHLVLLKQHISTFYTFSNLHYFLEFVIWLTPQHHLRHHDIMIMFRSSALVLVKQHISLFCNFSKLHYFSNLLFGQHQSITYEIKIS